jgi:hypothetical protein
MTECLDCGYGMIGITLVCAGCWDKRYARDGDSALARLTEDAEAARPGINLRPKVKKQENRETKAQRAQRERRHKWGKGIRLWTDV